MNTEPESKQNSGPESESRASPKSNSRTVSGSKAWAITCAMRCIRIPKGATIYGGCESAVRRAAGRPASISGRA
ncbi:hypothetical protein EVAR_50071_1 [Eumeta japonica]|uniref:Uncharacterized protein n=1 Tax=Eumeta variegata TaxID=151549 RepID=A0A4C1XJ41_EUMVA|nr:hypothetical protein EVAR_50071_1 [Eumeta japonica]